MKCDQCELMRINGVVCHEPGCPETWKDEVRECKWCGQTFTPEERYQSCCDEDCRRQYCGIDDIGGEG